MIPDCFSSRSSVELSATVTVAAMDARSYRQIIAERFAHLDTTALLSATGKDGSLSIPPRFLDLRLGNQCNLRCIMCQWPTSSSWARHGILDPWRSDEEFFSRFLALAPHLERLYFAGGEPLLQPAHHRIIQDLITSNHAHHIELAYSTNLTVLPGWCAEAWPRFARVDLGVSCDGVGPLFERIRVGARWDRFLENLQQVRQLPIAVRIAVTPQEANLEELPALVRWASQEDLCLDLSNILQYPPRLSLAAAGPARLSRVQEELTALLPALSEAARAPVHALLGVFEQLISPLPAPQPAQRS